MRIKLVIALLITILMVPNSAIPFQNEPDGFRDIKWGTDFSKFDNVWKSFSKEFCGKKYEVAHITGDNLYFENIKLRGIGYILWEGELNGVIVESIGNGLGSKEWYGMKNALFATYGDSNSKDITANYDKYQWMGDKTTILLMRKIHWRGSEFAEQITVRFSGFKSPEKKKEMSNCKELGEYILDAMKRKPERLENLPPTIRR